MKRLWLGIGILAVLLALGCLTAFGVSRLCTPAAEALEQASDAVQTGQWEDALDLAARARRRWERYRELNAAVTNHEPMEEVDALFASLEVYGRRRDILGFADCCARLSSLIRAIAESQSAHWWNVL